MCMSVNTHTHILMLMDTFSHSILKSSLGNLVHQLFKKSLCDWVTFLFSGLFLTHCLLRSHHPLTKAHLIHGAIIWPIPERPALPGLWGTSTGCPWELWAIYLLKHRSLGKAAGSDMPWDSSNTLIFSLKRGLHPTLKMFLISQTIRSTTTATQMGVCSKPSYAGD